MLSLEIVNIASVDKYSNNRPGVGPGAGVLRACLLGQGGHGNLEVAICSRGDAWSVCDA